jgi:hypothetical protein
MAWTIAFWVAADFNSHQLSFVIFENEYWPKNFVSIAIQALSLHNFPTY